jgi:hypothetical protein
LYTHQVFLLMQSSQCNDFDALLHSTRTFANSSEFISLPPSVSRHNQDDRLSWCARASHTTRWSIANSLFIPCRHHQPLGEQKSVLSIILARRVIYASSTAGALTPTPEQHMNARDQIYQSGARMVITARTSTCCRLSTCGTMLPS